MRTFILCAALAVIACVASADLAFASVGAVAGAGSGLAAMAPFATVAAAMAAGRLPRAIINRIQCDVDPRAMLAQIADSVEALKATHAAEMKALSDHVGELSMMNAAARVMPGGAAEMFVAPDPAYTAEAQNYVRRGNISDSFAQANQTGERQQIRAAMSTGSAGDGGYVAPIEWDRRITKALASESPLRALCNVVPTGGAGFSTVWSNGSWGSGWVGETANRPQTTTPALSSLIFKAGELYANPAVTQILLEDAAFNFEAWLADEVSGEFARQESIAFISGDGTNKPQGFLSYIGTGTTLHPGGEPGVTASGHASQLTGDGVLSLIYALAAPYRTNAAFVMNSASAGAMRKLKDGQGNYLWQPNYIVGQPQTIAGYPLFIDESMPDVGANNFPIGFGAWKRFYTINDRLGTSILRDPYTAKPFVLFYTRKRVGGGIFDPKAVRFLKIAAS